MRLLFFIFVPFTTLHRPWHQHHNQFWLLFVLFLCVSSYTEYNTFLSDGLHRDCSSTINVVEFYFFISLWRWRPSSLQLHSSSISIINVWMSNYTYGLTDWMLECLSAGILGLLRWAAIFNVWLKLMFNPLQSQKLLRLLNIWGRLRLFSLALCSSIVWWGVSMCGFFGFSFLASLYIFVRTFYYFHNVFLFALLLRLIQKKSFTDFLFCLLRLVL